MCWRAALRMCTAAHVPRCTAIFILFHERRGRRGGSCLPWSHRAALRLLLASTATVCRLALATFAPCAPCGAWQEARRFCMPARACALACEQCAVSCTCMHLRCVVLVRGAQKGFAVGLFCMPGRV